MDKIVCFGKNYSDHMLELGDAPVTKPVIFLKPPSVLNQCHSWGSQIVACTTNSETHYECELVLQLKHGGYRMNATDAKSAIGAYSIGLDMTLRREQAVLKQSGHPWTVGKVFPDAAIIGPWIKYTNMDFMDKEFKFTLDGVVKQSGYGRNMLFKPEELIVYASQFFPLCAGDILYTGTPSGVGPIKSDSSGTLQIANCHYSVKWQPIE